MEPAEVLAWASSDPRVLDRYWSHVARMDGTTCWIWSGAISGQGHGRFWVGNNRVVIAHRLAWAIAHPGEPVPSMVRHDCDNPLCQNPTHLRAGDASENRRDYFGRLGVPGSPLNDVRGSRERSRALRDAAKDGDGYNTAEQSGWSDLDRYQPSLW